MSQKKDGSNQGSFFRVSRETPRLLETPNGWRLVGYNDRELGRIKGLTQRSFDIPNTHGALKGTLYSMDRLHWSHAWALLFIQGAPIQQLIGPNYAHVGSRPSDPFDVRPHLKDVLLARVTEAPPSMSLEEAVLEVRRWSSS
jgi:hypothetical protein